MRAWAAVAAFLVLASCAPSERTAGAHDETIIGESVRLAPETEIRGNLNVVDAHVLCDGATIDGDVRTYFGTFEATEDCTIGGRVASALDAQSALVVAPWLAPDTLSRAEAETRRLYVRLAYGIIVLIMFLLFPMRTRTALDRVERHPALSALVGTLATIAVVPVAVLLAVTIIGIPLIVVEIAAFCAMLWIGEAAVALLIGRRFYELVRPQTTPPPLGALLVGIVLITIAEILPVVGWAVTAIVSLVGVGCAGLAFVQERSFVPFVRPGAAGAGPSAGTGTGPNLPMRTP